MHTRALRCFAAAVTIGLAVTACSSSGKSSDARGGTVTRETGVGAGLAGIGTLPAPASAWPQALYDARHSSGTSAVGPQTDHVRWTRKLESDATPGPVLGIDGTVLAASSAGVLHDLDPATGKDVWIYDGKGSYGNDLSTSPAVLGDGTILWPGPNDTLFAVSKAGQPLWSEKFTAQVLSPAIAGKDRVYVADLKGHLTALQVSGSAHAKLWTLDLGGDDYASATVGPDGTIYTAAGNDLVAVRDLGANAAVLFRFHSSKPVEVSNAVAPDGTIVLGTNNDKQYGVAPGGSTVWSFAVGDNTYSSSAVRPDGTGYFGDNTGRLHILDTKTGKIAHTITPLGDGKEKIWTSPAVDAHGDVYWGSTAGNVYGYTAAATQLFHLKLDSGTNSYPAIDKNGTLYIGSTAGTLYAIGK